MAPIKTINKISNSSIRYKLESSLLVKIKKKLKLLNLKIKKTKKAEI